MVAVAKQRKARSCPVCVHPERKLIETWLSDARPPRQIALRVGGLSRRAIRDHLHNCQSLDEQEDKVSPAEEGEEDAEYENEKGA